jgi:2-oxoglutarate/2-oxoacid ferredoxin oxidoreductase subunit alpha
MNNWMSDPFEYPTTPIKRGKVLSKADLDRLGTFARYKDLDGDGVGYRTLPGTEPSLPLPTFTRGSGHNDKSSYSERPDDYENNMERLNRKFESARSFVPRPEIHQRHQRKNRHHRLRHLALGSKRKPRPTAKTNTASKPIILRLRAYPFTREVHEFIEPNTSASTWSSKIATRKCSACSSWT